MLYLRNAIGAAWCLVALTAPLSSHAASDPVGMDFVVGMNPQSGSAYRSSLIWYVKGFADQLEISEAITAKSSNPPMPDSEWAVCRNKVSPEDLATKVSEKIMVLKLDKQPMAWAVSVAVRAACDSRAEEMFKFGLQNLK